MILPKYRNCISEFPEIFSNFRSFVILSSRVRSSKILLFWRFYFSFLGFFDAKSVCSTLFGLLYFSLVPFKKERFLDRNKNWQKFGLDGFSKSATSVLQLALCCHLPVNIQSNSVGYNWWRGQGCLRIQGTMVIITLDCNISSKL